jgi:hypothetical protein
MEALKRIERFIAQILTGIGEAQTAILILVEIFFASAIIGAASYAVASTSRLLW